MQALDQRQHLVLEHAGHQPFAALIADLVEREDGHGHGHAVARIAGLVQVGGRAVDTTQADHLGKGRTGDAGGLVAHQLVPGQAQQLGLALARGAEPLVEGGAAVHVARQVLVVEGEDQLVVHQHVLAAALVLQLLDLAHQLEVGGQEVPVRVPLALHQRLADELGARRIGIDPAVADAAAAVDHQAVERGALQRHHVGLLLGPVRVQQLLFQQVRAHLFQPLRLDGGNAAAIQARGLDLLGRHDPAPASCSGGRRGAGGT